MERRKYIIPKFTWIDLCCHGL